MSKQKFNLGEWRRDTALTPQEEVETIVSRIEAAHVDLTATYAEWIEIGFALAHGLGEEGRGFFHRLSRFYSSYRAEEADKQYTACLRSRGQGVTLNTLFYRAKLAGVDINTRPLPNCHVATWPKGDVVVTEKEAVPAPGAEETLPPAFPDEVYASLPGLLAEVCSYGISPEDTDMLLLGSVTVLSACMAPVWGVYGQRLVHPNEALFVYAPASAGKGRLTLCRHLVDVVHADLRRQNIAEWEEYRRQKAKFDREKRKVGGEEPQQPPVRMLFIPANSSATALFQTLNDNGGQALMFETEGDTLANTFKSEHGNYSDGLRKAFHHEPITYNRRKDREYVEISHPRLSVLLSGTPRQIRNLIDDVENGLFSRFLFYNLPLRPMWNDVFARSAEETLDAIFLRMGGRFFQFHTRLRQVESICFTFNLEQQQEFNAFFTSLQDRGLRWLGTDILASIRRLGLSAYRLCMVFSVLRLMDYEGDVLLPETLYCRDDDFHTVLLMMEVLLRHTGAAYKNLVEEMLRQPKETQNTAGTLRERKIERLLELLPQRFCRTEYLDKGRELSIPTRSADRYIVELCNRGKLDKQGKDLYIKV